MISIEIDDVQGFVLRGYKQMKFARYVMLKVKDSRLAKKWLNEISSKVSKSSNFEKVNCINLALTFEGLKALGLQEPNLETFISPFREGIFTSHRSRLLGDDGGSCPTKWNWGGPLNEEIHIMLLLFGATDELLQSYFIEQEKLLKTAGLSIVCILDGQTLKDNKEHFGFRDGISQPIIKGAGREGMPENTVATGEFLLGYKNEYGVFPDSPLIISTQGNINLLPTDANGSGYKDLGRNGSYLVFRQLKQDVAAFWKFMNENSTNPDGSLNIEESIKIASKMVGRWPSGAPLVKFPEKDPGVLSNDDDFNYAKTDKNGEKCPFGSHLRRVNPRDVFEDNGPKKSLKLTNRHRIIRRARLYGKPIVGSPTNFTPDEEVGLHFMCFNADISKQFEFLMHTWANYPKFQQLYNDPDPIIGTRDHNLGQNFTIQKKPSSRCIKNLQRFVTVRGGAYFFFPSIQSIRYLASL
jgi:Dyp-type peroxidase family